MSSEEAAQPYYIFKICLIGETAVGKTSLARRLCFDRFDIKTQLTLGIDFYTHRIPLVVNDEETFITLSIWDFGGQYQFKKLFSYYVNGANGIFMVFSLVDNQTLIGLDWWYEQLGKFEVGKAPRILIGAKADLVEETSKKEQYIVQQFMYRHDEKSFVKTSSKDNLNVGKAFNDMAKLILDTNDFEYDKLL